MNTTTGTATNAQATFTTLTNTTSAPLYGTREDWAVQIADLYPRIATVRFDGRRVLGTTAGGKTTKLGFVTDHTGTPRDVPADTLDAPIPAPRGHWGTYRDVTPGDTVRIPAPIPGSPYHPGYVPNVQHWGPAGPRNLHPAFTVSSVRTYGSMHPALGVEGHDYAIVVNPDEELWITPDHLS